MPFLWVDGTSGGSWKERKALVTSAIESGAEVVAVKAEDIANVRKLSKTGLLLQKDTQGEVEKERDLVLIGRGGEGDGTLEIPEKLERSLDLRGLKDLKKAGFRTVGYVEIHSKPHERLAALEAREADHVIVVGRDWTVIPLENLIAELQREKVQILAGVRDAEEAKLALETLEVGVDGIFFQGTDQRELRRIAKLVQESSGKVDLAAAKVKRLEQVGTGDRVCVDTASLLDVGEGMLVGSQSEGLFLVHSETLETEYVSARPFRVNAGAVHAYILTPGEKTAYLSEVKAGDEVLVTNSEGRTRKVTVGRVKIERRPLMLLEAEHGGRTYKTLLQNAETIMLVDGNGKPVSISRLEVGDEVLVHVKGTARHFGMEVEETVIER